MRDTVSKVKNATKVQTKSAISYIEATTTQVQSTFDTYVAPTRQSILKRFPILFSLLVTFGVATTFLGFERVVSQIVFLDQYPVVMLILGVGILALTGTLYKKLQ